MTRNFFKIWQDPSPEKIGHSVKEFLLNMNEPTWINMSGKDKSRRRILVTLLHGNEPSGLKAVFNWLSRPNRPVPVTDISFFICSVKAALLEPAFTHRYMPNMPDMNRCFYPPFLGHSGLLAEKILNHINVLKPEAVIDMHNTSGSGPNFCVTTSLEDKYIQLSNNFSDHLILTELSLGALMEADIECPIITLECGGSIDFSADKVAMDSLAILTSYQDIFQNTPHALPRKIYKHPLRFELKEDTTLCYGNAPVQNMNVTLIADIERHNFGVTAKNEFLGWVGERGLDYFTAINDKGIDIKDKLFHIDDNKIYTALPLQLFMITPRPEIAKKDCLFYLVKAD
ncbi:MAG: succinylglutamate desuccinylase/aspartoacylase family protein [Emcibacter sp.]|nr:succinylglutamate desuccinylase/aspartoacylase family protein [Emcibacter sp.]